MIWTTQHAKQRSSRAAEWCVCVVIRLFVANLDGSVASPSVLLAVEELHQAAYPPPTHPTPPNPPNAPNATQRHPNTRTQTKPLFECMMQNKDYYGSQLEGMGAGGSNSGGSSSRTGHGASQAAAGRGGSSGAAAARSTHVSVSVGSAGAAATTAAPS